MKTSPFVRLGMQAPEFILPGVDGKVYSLESFQNKSLLIVIFSCNHCPYVQAYEPRIRAVQRDYELEGVQVIAINSNDEKHFPEDSFENMVLSAKSKAFNYPYLRDADQITALAFGATHTPQVFLFNRERSLAYTGRIDDNWEDPMQVQKEDLRRAIDQILSGRPVSVPITPVVGCTIKWPARESASPLEIT